MKLFNLLPVLLLPLGSPAQEHPYLSYFTVEELDGAVRLTWEMLQGSTCFGITVHRGTDSLQLHPVGGIAGNCGSIGTPVWYEWIDHAPLELTTLYYRLELGTNGFSLVHAIRFHQLIGVDHRAFPSPAGDRLTILLRAPLNTSIDLRVFNDGGAVMLQREGLQGRMFEVEVSTWSPGIYRYEALADGRRFSGSFAVLH